jgi:peptidylprolyl isomerase
MSEVKAGDTVHIHYTGKFEDGTVFDSSVGGDPVTFVAGSEELIRGVSEAVLGMILGEKKTVTLPPGLAYGDHEPELVRSIPIGALPEGTEVGDQLRASDGEHETHVWVTDIGEQEATVDANHPLAGKMLVFDLEVMLIGAGA